MLHAFHVSQSRLEPLPCGIVRSRIVESLVVPRRILFVCGSLEDRRDQRAGFRFRRLPCVNRLGCKFHFMLLFSIVHSLESFAWSRSLISSSHNKITKMLRLRAKSHLFCTHFLVFQRSGSPVCFRSSFERSKAVRSVAPLRWLFVESDHSRYPQTPGPVQT